jgi:PEP-CTERM motif
MRNLFSPSCRAVSAAAAWALLAAVPASATTVSFDVTGIESRNVFSSPGNTVAFLQLAPFAEVTRIDFDVNLSAFGPSWLSELQVVFTDSDITTGVFSSPGFGANNNGTQSFTGFGDLVAQGLNFNVGADGRLRLEFADQSDDPEVNPDGRWNFGSLTFTVSAVPEPSTYGLMALGLGAVVLARRRQGSPRRAD